MNSKNGKRKEEEKAVEFVMSVEEADGVVEIRHKKSDDAYGSDESQIMIQGFFDKFTIASMLENIAEAFADNYDNITARQFLYMALVSCGDEDDRPSEE